ncbi:MAG: hypothetical protein ACPGTO_10500 [Polaribacter sp.]
MKVKKRKWSSSEVVNHIKKIEKIVKKQKAESKLENFTEVTREELEMKFLKVNSPMIVSQSWNHTNQGGVVNYNLGIYNPDPTNSIWTFAHVWVGSGNVVSNVGNFLNNVDTRFPRLTEPSFAGLNLAPGASATLRFSLDIPSSVEETNYIGNSCLMRFNWHDVGTYFDRGVFVFKVS